MLKNWKWLVLSVTWLAGTALAQGIEITDAWVRATVVGQKSTGAFMTIKASQDARLVGASTPLAGVVQLHEMSMKDNIMRMGEMAQGLTLPAGQTVMLKPGGYHIMLMDLNSPAQLGQTVVLSLRFQDPAGKPQTVEVRAPVRPLNPGAGGAGMVGHDKAMH